MLKRTPPPEGIYKSKTRWYDSQEVTVLYTTYSHLYIVKESLEPTKETLIVERYQIEDIPIKKG